MQVNSSPGEQDALAVDRLSVDVDKLMLISSFLDADGMLFDSPRGGLGLAFPDGGGFDAAGDDRMYDGLDDSLDDNVEDAAFGVSGGAGFGGAHARAPPPGGRVAPFIGKLFEIATRHPTICSFGADGDTLVVLDPKVQQGPRACTMRCYRHTRERL